MEREQTTVDPWCDACQQRSVLRNDRSGQMVCGHFVTRVTYDLAEGHQLSRHVCAVRCVYCKWEKIETTKEVAELRIQQHLNQAHGIIMKEDGHVA